MELSKIYLLQIERNVRRFRSTFNQNLKSNEIIEKHQFSDNLKLADVTPVFKKEDRNLVNYKHVSVLTVISKIFETKLHKQIVSYIDKYLSPYRCAVYGYSKGYYIQQVLNSLIESWRIMIHKKGYTGQF